NPAPMHASVAAGVSKRGLLAANEVAGGIWVMGRSTAAFGCNLNPMTALTTSNCPLSAPLASFSSNTTQTCPGGTVTFTDQSQRTTSWDWRFPGGTPATSTQQNPTVTYNTAGVYDVTLIAINAAGSDTSYQQAYITVAPPAATISGTANIITGNSAFIRFDLTGTAPWNVTYTDGTTNFPIVIPQSPHFVSVSPTITTAYTIVSVNDAGCAGSGQGSANITVGPPPPLRPGFGNPYWSFADQASSGIDVVKIGRGSNVQRWRIPYSGIVTDNISGFASDACGEPLFALVNIDRSRPNSSFCIDMQGNVLNSGNGFNAKNELAVQLIRVPETLNEWYVIYHRHSTNAYSLENVLYSRFRINCGNFTMLQKDIQLVDGSGSARLYTTHKAISPTTPVRPNTHWLYLCRRQQGSSATSLDRFLISKQGITWSANTGDIQVPWWGLTSAGSPIELSWQQDKIAVMYRNQDVNTTDLVIWDANQFSNAPAAHQRVSLGDLILQPDLAGIVTTAAAVDQIGQTNNSLLFLRNFERKMSRLEFSPSGQYLYIGAGGFVSGNFSNIDYLGQIDLNTPYPYAVRLQIQEPPFGTYNATTGQGCNRANNANCNNSFFANIGIRSGYDGKLYFFKFHSDSAYVIPQPDAPMPQMLTPGWVSLATATDTNIYMGAGGSISTIENIDGYRYPIENQTTPVIVSMRGCEGCLASAASPQDFEISTPGGTVLFCETIEQCPDTINVCVHPDSVYHLTWIQTGMFFNNAIVNGVAQQDSFVFVANTRPNVVLPQLPTICDTALQPISLSAIPQGGTFSGPGVVGNQFLPAVAGTGDHWIVYEIIDPNTRCKGIDSTKITIEFCCNLGAVSTLIQTVDLRCFGENIGSVSAVVSGATHVPLTYSLNGQAYQNSNQFSGLGAGIYTIYLRDTLNCDTSILFEIRSPDPFIIHDSLIGISCSGQNDASILVDTSGGTKPLSLFFNGSPSGGNTHFDNLSPGNYQIVVRDANGCSDTVDVQVPIRPPLSILFELIQDEICLGEEDGKIRIRGIGGTGSGYEFSLDGTNFQVADSFLNLSAGNYTIFLKDSNDCRTSETFTIDPGSQSIADFTVSTDECVLPTPVLLSNASQNAVQYDWNFGNGSSRQGFEPTFTYTDGGSYTITLITTDGNGCRDTAEQPIVIPRALVEVSLDSIGNISCFGRNDAFILVDTSGGVQPFTFQINGNPNGNDLRFANLSPGNYQIVAIDANGCSDTLDVEIPNIPSLDIVFELIEDEKCLGEMNGRVRFRGVGGSGRGYEFSLDGVNFQETDSFANLIPGNYTLFITDSDGCQINRPFTIEA
ncbi:MAG: PKD domain-containing protein, partial [Bacteroidia bacterium]